MGNIAKIVSSWGKPDYEDPQYISDSWNWVREQDKRGLMSMDVPKPELNQNSDLDTFLQKEKAYGARQQEVAANNSPLERWKRQIDNLMRSGSPGLMKQAQSMLNSYHDKATASSGQNPSAAMQGYGLAKQEGYAGDFMQYQQDNRPQQFENTRISPSDALKMQWLDPNNKTPLVGLPYSEVAGKVKSVSVGERTDENKQKKAGKIVSEMEDMLFGKDGIYNDYSFDADSVSGKVKDTAKANYEYFMQNDTRFKNYTDFQEGTLSPLVKSMGEVGNLAVEDIARARSLLPLLFGPKIDSRKVAREKLNKLSRLLDLTNKGQLNTETFRKVIWEENDGPVQGVFWANEEKPSGN